MNEVAFLKNSHLKTKTGNYPETILKIAITKKLPKKVNSIPLHTTDSNGGVDLV